jgi:hypothetical protein
MLCYVICYMVCYMLCYMLCYVMSCHVMSCHVSYHIIYYIILYYINFGPYHNGTARPLLADGEYGLKIRSATAIIMSNQSRTAYKGRSSSLSIGRRTNNFSQSRRQLATERYNSVTRKDFYNTVVINNSVTRRYTHGLPV